MTRKDCLDALQSALVTESASAIAIGNMVSTFGWSGLPEQQRSRVMSRLEDLAEASQRRAQRLKEFIARVQGSSQDVF